MGVGFQLFFGAAFVLMGIALYNAYKGRNTVGSGCTCGSGGGAVAAMTAVSISI